MIGIENSINYLNNFDPDKYTKPFAYFTQICYYAFVRRINKEKKQKVITYKMIQNVDKRGEFHSWAKNNGIESDGNDALAEYLRITSDDIAKYEAKKNNKKKQTQKKNSKHDTGLEIFEENNE